MEHLLIFSSYCKGGSVQLIGENLKIIVITNAAFPNSVFKSHCSSGVCLIRLCHCKILRTFVILYVWHDWVESN